MFIQTAIDDYSRQHDWRSWPIVFAACQNVMGRLFLTLDAEAQNPFLTATPEYILRRLKSRFAPTQFLSQSIHSTIERG